MKQFKIYVRYIDLYYNGKDINKYSGHVAERHFAALLL